MVARCECCGAPAGESPDPLRCAYCGAGLRQPPPPGSAPPAMTEEAPPLVVADERPCLTCGYSIVGMGTDGVCPECGTPIIRSIRGNLLRYASRDHLRTLVRGAALVEAAMILSIVASFLTTGATLAYRWASAAYANVPSLGRTLEVLPSLADLGGSLLTIWGWWMLSTPDPGLAGTDLDARSRRWLRIFIIAMLAKSVGEVLIPFLPASMNPRTVMVTNSGNLTALLASPLLWAMLLIGLFSLATTIGKFVSSMLYLRSLARRLPDMTMAKRLGAYLWVLPLLYTVGALLCGLGPLIALVLYLIAIDQLRRAVSPLARSAPEPA